MPSPAQGTDRCAHVVPSVARPVSPMRELEREKDLTDPTRIRCAIVGAGRLGRALVPALRAAGVTVAGPFGRGWSAADEPDLDVVLLCVPDAEIAAAAATIAPRRGLLVGHCSGATTLAPLVPHERLSLHPLMTVPADGAAGFAGATAAVAGSTPDALAVATALANSLRMTAVEVADRDRAAYHAAASVASNFLVTLEAAAERIAETAGIDRSALVPLVKASFENWAALGPERALTGPLVRGDEATVARQRDAIEERTPELLDLFDALADATRSLAREAVAT
ncbi:Rossmann-like and DUF2520 domain-containing protein [Conexibacter sp. CPCC 206217]|uniref:Rossmann-like and DUF2520 domain-containing protein n=1 Tax=Conexibacter sp. CPCC 206217 TaxID=3064574 RepID=UPI002719257A|nr:Rossmann-like and DUF2520 domain-containing protein [Conexibacter sp. CPCC 206217]MDO8210938.1 DUF2520 domain-containing protein [Conexibacter sp. CPCC 206217]